MEPAWAPNGRELFYRTFSGSDVSSSMVAVDITSEPTFTADRPRQLFKDDKYAVTEPLRNYDVTPDGRWFLMVRTESQPEEPVTEIHIVLNWHQELLEKVPVQ